VLVVDNSGSMGDNVGGMSKMDLAKEAALGALDLLAPTDQLGLLAFDDRPHWLRDIAELDEGSAAFACLEVDGDGPLPLLARIDAEPPLFLVKSGRVGGSQSDAGSLPVTERDAEAALDAALDPATRWERDPDLRLELIAQPVGGVEPGLLVPRFLYRRANRVYEYAAAIPQLQPLLDSITAR
jgi:hypothetical protein